MNNRSIFETLFCLDGVNVYVGGTAASVARQVPLEPRVLQAMTHEETRARSQEGRLFTVGRCYMSIALIAKWAS